MWDIRLEASPGAQSQIRVSENHPIATNSAIARSLETGYGVDFWLDVNPQ